MKVNKLVSATIVSFGILTSVQAGEYTGMEDEKPKKVETSQNEEARAGLEIRGNFGGAGGTMDTHVTVTDPYGSIVHTESASSDISSKGYSFLIGYGTEVPIDGKSGFIYVGIEDQTWTGDSGNSNDYNAFLFGAEGGIGNKNVKFVYGGEFGIGSIDTGTTEVGSLSTFTAEPFIGLRITPVDRVSINLRVGVRGYFIEDTVYSYNGYTGTGENHLLTTNAQIGVGYSFY